MSDYQTNYLTERELFQIYKEDYFPMSKQLMEGMQIDTYLWVQEYAPDTSPGELCMMILRILGRNVPKKYKRKLKNNSEKNVSDHPPGMTDAELIDYYLNELKPKRKENCD